jgi:hypothetical protein
VQAIVSGRDAKVDPGGCHPNPMLFWHVIRLLQEQNMSMKQCQIEIYKRDSAEVLGIEL